MLLHIQFLHGINHATWVQACKWLVLVIQLQAKQLTVSGKKAIAPRSPTIALKKGKMHASTVVMQTIIDLLISFKGLIGSLNPPIFRMR